MTYKTLARSAIVATVALIAVVSARPHAGSWNDGSRLAMVESLGDRGTFQIDDSIYVHPETAAIAPYTPGDELLARDGTKDKLFIDGHFYSDKSPLPGVLMAGAYRVMRWCGLPAARERPDWFALAMTWLFAGLPYVLAMWCVGRIMGHLAVSEPWDAVLTGGFAFGTLAMPYAQQVNNHVLLLAVAAGAFEVMSRCTTGTVVLRSTTVPIVWLGMLAGFAYTIDLGTGPLLTAAAGGWVLWQRRGVLTFALGAVPFITAHHAMNYAVAGTLLPGNANPEFFEWPGSPFGPENMTGTWHHDSPSYAALYALDLLFGKKGFLLFSLQLIQAAAGTYWLVRYRSAERPVMVAGLAWAVSTWLLFSAGSRNLSGQCLSIRWFVPLLVPGFVALGLLVRDYPRSRGPLAPLLVGNIILNVELTLRGPWWGHVPVVHWPVVGLSVTGWVSMWLQVFRTWRRSGIATSPSPTARLAPSTAGPTG
jgi:hypothetical protein